MCSSASKIPTSISSVSDSEKSPPRRGPFFIDPNGQVPGTTKHVSRVEPTLILSFSIQLFRL